MTKLNNKKISNFFDKKSWVEIEKIFSNFSKEPEILFLREKLSKKINRNYYAYLGSNLSV